MRLIWDEMLARHKRRPRQPSVDIVAWNDAEKTTKEQVLKVLNKAINKRRSVLVSMEKSDAI